MFFCIKHNTKRPNIIIGESKIQKPVSIHAEANGIKKLQDIYKEKHKILTYDLLVFRIFHNKSLHYSRPCYHCIRKLENSLFIKIRNVYYTIEMGQLKCESFKDLVDSADNGTAKISSGYRLRIFGEDEKDKSQYTIKNKKIKIEIKKKIKKR